MIEEFYYVPFDSHCLHDNNTLLFPDEEIIDFYPTMFFLLSDLVTYFGDLVHDRLVTKCPDLKVNFTFSDVGPQARELCKNWLYKIASIRGK